jgi:hypothetical protein
MQKKLRHDHDGDKQASLPGTAVIALLSPPSPEVGIYHWQNEGNRENTYKPI